MTVSCPHIEKGMVLYFISLEKKKIKVSGLQAAPETDIRISLVMLDVQTHTNLKATILGLPIPRVFSGGKEPEIQKIKSIRIKVLSLNSLSASYPSHCETSKIFDFGFGDFCKLFSYISSWAIFSMYNIFNIIQRLLQSMEAL